MKKIKDVIAYAECAFVREESSNQLTASLCRLLNKVKAQDLGLDKLMANLDPLSQWDTKEIYHTSKFSLQLFMLTKGNKIPLHNHPHMWVLMRVLWGKLQICAYDWAREYPMSGLARKCYQETIDGSAETLTVEPDKGNIHEIYAIEDCAFLDLLFPPYAPSQGRDCDYYFVEEEIELHGEKLKKLVVE